MGNEKPLITVGIPTYNRPEGLRVTLERITNQTYKSIEILVSDNASNDAEVVKAVVEEYSRKDPRVIYYRQEKNLGSILNFHFLLSNAKGEYFCWAADDDEVESEYVEDLYRTFETHENIVLAMSAYDVNDVMSQPPIKINLTKYLVRLVDKNPYRRLRKYVTQPDHFGKSRLVWGMFKTKMMLKSFNLCLDKRGNKNQMPIWSELPIEFRLLSYGNFAVGRRNLFHVNLLPSSEGKRVGPSYGSKMLDICRRSFHSYESVINDAVNLKPIQKFALKFILKIKNYRDQFDVLVYYTVERYLPKIARLIKKVIYGIG